jgi:hypothetical protein
MPDVDDQSKADPEKEPVFQQIFTASSRNLALKAVIRLISPRADRSGPAGSTSKQQATARSSLARTGNGEL